ncbi:MAG: PilZ domain-containing protein, partial [Nitrospira sp.]|nr:PilZ domain-containing protein [Nitrospira sp.]
MSPQALKKLGSLFGRSEAPPAPAPSKPQETERRIQPRFTTQFRSTFSGQRQEGQGRTLDISAGGCKIESELKVERGGSGNSDSVVSGSLASPMSPRGGEPEEQGDEEN